jgi:hypothetical protein
MAPDGMVHILVGGLEHEFYDFPYLGNVIIPTDELIFFRGVGIPPTSMVYIKLVSSNGVCTPTDRTEGARRWYPQLIMSVVFFAPMK